MEEGNKVLHQISALLIDSDCIDREVSRLVFPHVGPVALIGLVVLGINERNSTTLGTISCGKHHQFRAKDQLKPHLILFKYVAIRIGWRSSTACLGVLNVGGVNTKTPNQLVTQACVTRLNT